MKESSLTLLSGVLQVFRSFSVLTKDKNLSLFHLFFCLFKPVIVSANVVFFPFIFEGCSV